MLLASGVAVKLGVAQTDESAQASEQSATTLQAMAQLAAPAPPGSFAVAENDARPLPSPVLVSGTALGGLPDCVARLNRFLSPVSVTFDMGSADISTQNVEMLSRISEEIIACDRAYVMVAGHADGSGEDAVNLALSWERADRTLNRLLSLGVDPQAIEAIGFGARMPLSQGSDEEGIDDRRVDFRVMRRP